MGDSNIFRREALERLSSPEQLDQLMQIVSPRSWLPLATVGGLLGAAIFWACEGRIPVTTSSHAILAYAEGESGELVGVAHFPTGELAQIEPGMDVLLIPDVEGNKQAAGGIEGKVSQVSLPTVMTLDGVRQLDDPAAPTTIEVLIELTPDPNTSSGYKWSASSLNMIPLGGMHATARVTLDEKAPLWFVLPFLHQS
ncbi:secretion protein [Leptolyngbya sp. Heron Island J]|uniref:hypothetical protein n=1 Tax=Leptolyngbya sp. Heron Island J TaxID=1385935 RepID=UPI0003B9C459|nr:hypothetical protein [Leptolyngbya sp. Heron Island J]ESA38601.1 secretion protein [Leptolyngbya sp. Heron Island J]